MMMMMMKLQWALLLLTSSSYQCQAAMQEPWVENLKGIFQKDDCNKIIEAAEAFGFPNSSDSIDYNEPRSTVSWAIDVVLDQEIEVASIASIYDKYLDQLRTLVHNYKIQWVKNNEDDTSTSSSVKEPTLDWVFLRKYTAGEKRYMLKLHHDINLFTVNIALNDDFEGGGLFYHRNDDDWFPDGQVGVGIPDFPLDKLNYDYLETITRQNTTDIVFPDLHTGDVLIHNHSLFHAIAPLVKGTRYSLVFFYDMHHPAVAHNLQVDLSVTVENFFDFPVDLVVIDNQSVDVGIHRIAIVEELPAEYTFLAVASQHYEIIDRETGDIVDDFDVYNDKPEGEAHFIYVGPEREEDGEHDDEYDEYGEDDEDYSDGLDKIATIENYFPYPVDLYWLDAESPYRERVLMQENLEEVFEMDSTIGHEFEIIKKDTSEVIHYFEVAEPDEDGEFIFVVGPARQDQQKDDTEL
eukprot:CAMPEP_0119015792 /NCGR_PEP_ID=MMETSP1176-20130426/11634_1 /TAXON_ID=265551 /ORGANISM="Synedropsis recta cf, Strain CCMP1620" /LENGTH=463 /DNA_ID=CAMNT_0006969113 /DNA_START=131 /DNA_END=1522 /DNA_ORIENTATION=+